MQVKISEFLKDYSLELSESILNGEIFKLTYTENLENIRFHVHFDSLVPSDDIFAFEKAVEAAIKVEQVRLACRYPAEKFGMDCYGELVKLLKRDIPVVNGFLDDADVSLIDDELRIRIVHGGRDILDRYNFCRCFSQLIYNQFGVRIKVILDGDKSVSREQFDEMIERIEADLPDYSNQLIPDKTSDEIRAEEVKSVIPTVTIDIGALNKEFDAESAEVIKGKAIREKPVPICEAVQHLGEKVVVVGDVFASELKEVRNEKTVVTYDVTDYSGSLKLKIFAKNEEVEELKLGSIKSGATLLVSGKLDYDSFARDIVISVNSLIKVKRIPKMDNYPEKRVELHCHTNMSAMDAVTDPVTLINRAAEWGHQAMAITDHGNVQAFPDCMYNMPKNFKAIYGMEAYVVNDIERDMVVYGDDDRSFDDEIIIFDVETTGLSFRNDRLTEIGAVKLKNLQVVDDFNTKVNPF